MGQWSREELNRTMDEVKRRSLVDSDFRTLAISHPGSAIAKINPKPLPLGVSIKFISGPHEERPSSSRNPDLTIVLPPPVQEADVLSDAELEQAAGGMTDIAFPFE